MGAPASELRKQVTSVMSVSASGVETVISRESVPMREEIFPPDKLGSSSQVADALHRIQRHIAESTQSSRSLPVLGGTYWPGVSLTANTNVAFAHGIQGNTAVSWSVWRPQAFAQVKEISQDLPNGRITLQASANVVCDLWFIPGPKAVR